MNTLSLTDPAGCATPQLRQRQAQQLVHEIGEPLISGNCVELLAAGAAGEAAMFEAIDAATDHVNLDSSQVGRDPGQGDELARRLVERCRRGVRVNLLLDTLGALRGSTELLAGLHHAGASVCEVQPAVAWRSALAQTLQLQPPRRLLVVDGRIGFIGAGAHDLRAKVQGPVLQRLQRQFIAHWRRSATVAMQHARYFPALAPTGTQRVGIAAIDAERRNAYGRALLGAVELARHEVVFSAADALPPKALQQALVRAAARGAKVELLLPAAVEPWMAWPMVPARIAQLARSGIRVLQRPQRSLHANACTVDGLWAGISHGHIDWRSALNDSAIGLVLIDEPFAQQLQQRLREQTRDAVVSVPAADSPAGWRRWSRRFELFD